MKVCFHSRHLLFLYEKAGLLSWRYRFFQGRTKDISSRWSSWNLSHQIQCVTGFDLLFLCKAFQGNLECCLWVFTEQNVISLPNCKTVWSNKKKRESKTKIHFSLEVYLVTRIWKPGYEFLAQTIFLSQAQVKNTVTKKYLHGDLLMWAMVGSWGAWGLSSVQGSFL